MYLQEQMTPRPIKLCFRHADGAILLSTCSSHTEECQVHADRTGLQHYAVAPFW